jgi:hypothetical protein
MSYSFAFSICICLAHALCSIQFLNMVQAAAEMPTGGTSKHSQAHHTGLLFCTSSITFLNSDFNSSLSPSFHTTTPLPFPLASACRAFSRTSRCDRTRFFASSAVRWGSRARRRCIWISGSRTATTRTVPQKRSQPDSKRRGTSRTTMRVPVTKWCSWCNRSISIVLPKLCPTYHCFPHLSSYSRVHDFIKNHTILLSLF